MATLTDPALPELDFEFAAIYLLDATPSGLLWWSAPAAAPRPRRLHRRGAGDEPGSGAARACRAGWRRTATRALDRPGCADLRGDAPARRGDRRARRAGRRPLRLRLPGRPAGAPGRRRSSAPTAASVRPACTRRACAKPPTAPRCAPADDEGAAYRPTDEFTLDGDLFAAYGHASLVRVFVPFGVGRAAGARATGVLEAGYHISRQQPPGARADRGAARLRRHASPWPWRRRGSTRTSRSARRQLEIVTEVSRAIADLHRPGADAAPGRAQHGARRRCLRLPDRAAGRGRLGLVRRGRLRSGGRVAPAARRAARARLSSSRWRIAATRWSSRMRRTTSLISPHLARLLGIRSLAGAAAAGRRGRRLSAR